MGFCYKFMTSSTQDGFNFMTLILVFYLWYWDMFQEVNSVCRHELCNSLIWNVSPPKTNLPFLVGAGKFKGNRSWGKYEGGYGQPHPENASAWLIMKMLWFLLLIRHWPIKSRAQNYFHNYLWFPIGWMFVQDLKFKSIADIDLCSLYGSTGLSAKFWHASC